MAVQGFASETLSRNDRLMIAIGAAEAALSLARPEYKERNLTMGEFRQLLADICRKVTKNDTTVVISEQQSEVREAKKFYFQVEGLRYCVWVGSELSQAKCFLCYAPAEPRRRTIGQ